MHPLMNGMASDNVVTQLLHAHRRGRGEATEKLFEMVYDELHTMAHRQLLRRRPGQTLNTTALVHEAFLKMFDETGASWKDRAHFFAVTATAMRQILVDYARRQRADKRGGDAHHTLLQTALMAGPAQAVDVLELDDALKRLADLNPRLSRVVELRFFGGLSVEEIAEVLDVSGRTVDRDWYKAKAFLYLAMGGEGEPDTV